jgi:DNA-binding transcriptional MerR regulator
MFTLAVMTRLRVSELAARAGVAPSTVRFYERTGLLSPARRSANGYRVFDEAAAGELTLIARAKSIGMSLDDIASVVATWRDGPCSSLRNRLWAHLTSRITQVGEQRAGLETSQRRLQSTLARLKAHGPAPDRCGDGCGCDSGLAQSPGEAGPADADQPDEAEPTRKADAVLPGCSLNNGELTSRLSEWRAIADAAVSSERNGDTLRLGLAPEAIPAAAGLLAAEASCCTQARFTLDVTAGQVTLTTEVPGLSAALRPD